VFSYTHTKHMYISHGLHVILDPTKEMRCHFESSHGRHVGIMSEREVLKFGVTSNGTILIKLV
jgi:hypothetical protein